MVPATHHPRATSPPSRLRWLLMVAVACSAACATAAAAEPSTNTCRRSACRSRSLRCGHRCPAASICTVCTCSAMATTAETRRSPARAARSATRRRRSISPLGNGRRSSSSPFIRASSSASCAGRSSRLRGAPIWSRATARAHACSARVLDATDPDAIKPDATAVRRNASGNACMPLTVAQAARNAKSDSGQGGAGKDEANLRPGASADDLKGLMPQ